MEYISLFFIGAIATTIGTLAGGGGLISLPAMLLLGVPIHSAIGANKVSNTVSSFSSFLFLLKHKQISLRESFWVIPVSLVGGISGGFIATMLSEDHLIYFGNHSSIVCLHHFVHRKRGFRWAGEIEIQQIECARVIWHRNL